MNGARNKWDKFLILDHQYESDHCRDRDVTHFGSQLNQVIKATDLIEVPEPTLL